MRGCRGERGLPAGFRVLPAALLTAAARRRRAKGFYDRRTLALFRRAWLRARSASALMDYLLFRRDLGFALAPRWLAPLRERLPGLRGRYRRLALGLMAEIGADPAGGNDFSEDPGVIGLHALQDQLRDAFAAVLRRQREDGICVVGNAGSLVGLRLGATIDQHGLVVRFNRFRGADSEPADIGSRLDVWVVAPDFEGPPPQGVRWIVVSGPEMRFRRHNWESLRPALDAGAVLLTVPLAPWRGLVATLQAPPSAGLLFLAWLRSLLGSWDGVRAVGFGAGATPGAVYHHADPRHKAVGRHQWAGERLVLQAWHDEGLRTGAGRWIRSNESRLSLPPTGN